MNRKASCGSTDLEGPAKACLPLRRTKHLSEKKERKKGKISSKKYMCHSKDRISIQHAFHGSLTAVVSNGLATVTEHSDDKVR